MLEVSSLEGAPVDARPVEIVERKGLGHPDTICDALAEEVGAALSRFYLERFGFVLHHNVDKVLLRGGAARAAFGGGEVLEPIEIYLAGRATRELRGVRVPVEELALEACRAWLQRQLHALDPIRHVRVHVLIRPGSADLVDLFERQRRTGKRLANDTSIGVGFAPLSPLERAALAVERGVRGGAAAPERGEDVKVMGLRSGGRTRVLVACALVGGALRDLDDYLAARARAAEVARSAARGALGADPEIAVNAADDDASGAVYLTVTGTSAEAGDDGQTGRGNRANGLITPGRPMTLESVAGKNAITHVGKLYNVAAIRIAEALVARLPAAREAHVLLVSRIGAPIEEPEVVDLRLRADSPRAVADLAARAAAIAREELAGIGALWQGLLGRNLALG